jgi:hypothetical protein
MGMNLEGSHPAAAKPELAPFIIFSNRHSVLDLWYDQSLMTFYRGKLVVFSAVIILH